MSTQGAEFVRSGGKRLPFWQETPDAGTKLLVHSLPPFARCWRLAGSADHLIWKCKHGKERLGNSLSAGMEKGIITDFAKKASSLLIREGNFMAARALDFLVCGAINEPRLLADSQPIFLCALRPESLGHQEA